MHASGTRSLVAGTTCFLAFAVAASASADELMVEPDRAPNIIGLVVASTPDYMGSDDQTTAGAPLFRFQFKGSDRYFSLIGSQAKLNLIDSKRFRAGPVLSLNPGRQSGEISDAVVKRMKSIGSSTEVGLFGEYWIIDAANPRDRANVGITVLKDTGDGSDGTLVRIGATAFRQASPKVDLILGAAVEYANQDYMQTYFGVNAANVGTSGLSFFNAGSGVKDLQLTVGGLYYVNKTWMALGVIRYSLLQGDAADSPVVDQRGDKNQWLAGIGVAYLW